MDLRHLSQSQGRGHPPTQCFGGRCLPSKAGRCCIYIGADVSQAPQAAATRPYTTMKAFVCSFLVVLLVAAVFAQEKAKETLKGAEAYYAYAAPYAYSAFGYPAVSAYSAYPYAAVGYPYYYR
ncbi:uncharacterized protein LOC126253498 [Schistocerca nitens]|uniref:uncharacterized protein LOC126253498 n=1 Tax=Schistocerca nitens TaxID=7011 RepID=UPI00211935BD|nr:uncharacterized protein LOC126253498 [Schistocerca nitens]